jgi:hypothetical protein
VCPAAILHAVYTTKEIPGQKWVRFAKTFGDIAGRSQHRRQCQENA